jgi:hypothetical protein
MLQAGNGFQRDNARSSLSEAYLFVFCSKDKECIFEMHKENRKMLSSFSKVIWKMDLTYTGRAVGLSAQHRDQWRALVNTVMSLRSPQRGEGEVVFHN